MVGNRIKRINFLIFFFILFFSCKKQKLEHKKIDSIVFNYIDDFKKNKKIKKRNFLLHVNKDSTLSHLNVYRMNMWASLLEPNEIPNKTLIYKDIKVAFFTKRINDKNLETKIIKELKEKGFYRKDSTNFLSNYPEWVIINKKNRQLIVKDMWYFPIDSIIKKYSKEIN